jgi:hypothetical protein
MHRQRFTSPGIFLVLISVRVESTVRPEGLGKLKKSNDPIGIRARGRPDCSIAPETTVLDTQLHITAAGHRQRNKQLYTNCYLVMVLKTIAVTR